MGRAAILWPYAGQLEFGALETLERVLSAGMDLNRPYGMTQYHPPMLVQGCRGEIDGSARLQLTPYFSMS